MRSSQQIIQVGSRRVEITRPEKILFPAQAITKGELIDYYRRIAKWMLPHIKGRPVAMERYPHGIEHEGFLQKAVAPYYPDWIKTVTVRKASGTVRHIVCDDQGTLVFLANLACITPHVWLSRVNKLHHPDEMVFDLDPSGEDFSLVKASAQALGALLKELELPAYVKTTGSRGLHVAVPLRPEDDFNVVRALARGLAGILVNQDPEHRTLEQRKEKRAGRVFVDTNRNAYGQTMAPVFSVRARPHAPVSVPLHWAELSSNDLRPDGVNIRTVFKRLQQTGDAWAGFSGHAVSIRKARLALEYLNAAPRIS